MSTKKKSRAIKLVEDLLSEGYEYDGHAATPLDRDSDFAEDRRLDRNMDYIELSIAFKRRKP